VEEADGGVLLLDEIHRLGAEGQEMLFRLIDQGRYRRLGETGEGRRSNVILIGATTENTESCLLRTFTRRFPILIELPPLSKRPLSERCRIIWQTFLGESERIGLEIRVDREAMQAFSLYPCIGNIGRLIMDIRFACAHCFHNHAIDGKPVRIVRQSLPPHIQNHIPFDPGSQYAVDALWESFKDFKDFVFRPQIGERAALFDRENNLLVDRQTLPMVFSRIAREQSPANASPPSPEGASANSESGLAPAKPVAAGAAARDVERQEGAEEGDPSDARQTAAPLCVITTCVTGEGSAVKIAEYIKREIPSIADFGIEIIPLNIDAKGTTDLSRIGSRALAAVGTVEPAALDVPFIPLDELVFGDGLRKLTALLETAAGGIAASDAYVWQGASRLLKEMTTFIDTEKVIRTGREAFDVLSPNLHPDRLRSLQIRFLLHLACMLERVLQKLPLDTPVDTEPCDASRVARHAKISEAVKEIEREFGVRIPDAEIEFLDDLLYTV
ncbi:MAG: sigma 54-interacting transcriptional regulator, partial [Clostridiales Family XIII bacterium]|nr:sigma 54-interacting transcriptional regulator [Clostridiales Family XIII bacterium]